MARPICARLDDVVQPIRAELKSLRAGGGSEGEDTTGGPRDLREPQAAAQPSRLASQQQQNTPDGELRSATRRQSGGGVPSQLGGWAQGLMHLAGWAPELPPSALSTPPPSVSGRKILAAPLVNQTNDLVVVHRQINGSIGLAGAGAGGSDAGETQTVTVSSRSGGSKSGSNDNGGGASLGSLSPLPHALSSSPRLNSSGEQRPLFVAGGLSSPYQFAARRPGRGAHPPPSRGGRPPGLAAAGSAGPGPRSGRGGGGPLGSARATGQKGGTGGAGLAAGREATAREQSLALLAQRGGQLARAPRPMGSSQGMGRQVHGASQLDQAGPGGTQITSTSG